MSKESYRLLPSEKEAAIKKAKDYFIANGKLCISEPCDCGSRIMHNNGGNYHDIVSLRKDKDRYFIAIDSTSEFEPEADWREITFQQALEYIEKYGDWL